MFEGLVSDLLNRFLGTYIENLDSSKLKISIWGGDVQLKDLVIKQSALDDLELPIRPVVGHLDFLTIRIPWSKLYTEKWEVSIEGLSLVVVPNTSVSYDAVKEEQIMQETKMAALQKIEEAKLKNKKKLIEKDKKENDGFIEKLVAQIIRNIQVEIKNIYIRYEDNATSSTKPFAVGAMLKSLSLQSTDSNWTLGLDTASLIYKLLNLQSLLVYWSSDCQLLSQSSEEKDIFMSLNSHLDISEGIKDLKPVLGPLNLMAKLQLNPRPELDDDPFTVPKAILSIVLDELAVAISRHQFTDIMNLLDSIGRIQIASSFRKYRPNVKSIIGHASLWWKYAYECKLEAIRQSHRNWSWQHIKTHRDMCREYKKLYKKKFCIASLTKEEKDAITNLEKKLDLFNITLVRRQAEMESEREGIKQAEEQKKKGWFGGWFSWGSKPEQTEEAFETGNIAQKFEAAMSLGEKQNLYEAIGYTEGEFPTEIPVEYVDMKLKFVLTKMRCCIIDELMDSTAVCVISLNKLVSSLSQRSTSSATRLEASIESFSVIGLPQPGMTPPPKLAESLFVSSDVPLLSVLFETNPSDTKCDNRIIIDAQPLEIVYNAATVSQIVDIFSPPKDISLQQLQAAALNQFEIMKERSISGLYSTIQNRSVLDLNINIKASRVIFPELGYFHKSKSVIVVTLGSFGIESISREKNFQLPSPAEENFDQELLFERLKSSSYDYFKIHLDDIQVIVADGDETWEDAINSSDATSLHLLRPLSLRADIFKCLIWNDPNLPKFKINATLPEISLFILDSKIIKAAAVIRNCFNQEAVTPSYTQQQSFSEIKDFNLNVITDEVALVRLENVDINPTGESSVTPQFSEFVFSFTINAVTLDLSKDTNDTHATPLARISAKKIALNVTQKTFNLELDLTLTEITVNHLEWGDKCIVKTVNADGELALFSVKFCQVSPKNPDFYSYHRAVTQKIEIDMFRLIVCLEENVLLSLLTFGSNLQNDLYKIMPPVSDTEIIQEISKISDKSMKKENDFQEKMPSKGYKKIINAKLVQVDLILRRTTYDIATLNIGGLSAEILIQGEEVEIQSHLKAFSVINSQPEELFKDIVVFEEGDAWKVKINIYNQSKEEISYFDTEKVDIGVWVELGRPKIVFLNKIVTDILSWVDNFQVAKEALSSASQAAAEVAKANLKEVYSRCTKVKLDILLKAPLILLPSNSASYRGLLIDLGRLKMDNKFRLGSERSDIGHPSLFNDLTVMIQDVRISRKDDLRVEKESSLLLPLSLNIDIQMNFSSSWLLSVPQLELNASLKSVQMKLSEDDICTILSVLQGNFGETPVEQPKKFENTPEIQMAVTSLKEKEELLADVTGNYKKTTVCFGIDDITLELFTSDQGDGENKAERIEFAEFSLRNLKLKFDMLSDNTLSANVILLDCIVEDRRRDFQSGITRMMGRKDSNQQNIQPVIDVTFIQGRKKDIFVNVKVREFFMILHLPFLLRLQTLLSVQPAQDMEEVIDNISISSWNDIDFIKSKKQVHEIETGTSEISVTINCRIEQPDIVLVEDLGSLDTSCVILHGEIDGKIKIAGVQRNISATLNNMQMYTCCFNPDKQKETSSQILSKSDISFHSSATATHADNIQITFGTLNFRLAPDTVELAMSILSCLSSEERKVSVSKDDFEDWTGYWDAKPINFEQLTNLKIEEAVEADVGQIFTEESVVKGTPNTSLGSESLCVDMNCLLITLEAGSGSTSIPLLKLQSSTVFTAKGFFSSKLSINGHIVLEVAYFNPRQAIWEPILEPIEIPSATGAPSHRSCIMNFEGYTMLKDDVILSSSPSVRSRVSTPLSSEKEFEVIDAVEDEIDSIEILPPLTKLTFLSKDPLEFTITKTFLEVLNTLSEAFMEAYKGELSVRQSVRAPFKFFNRTGVDIILDLKESKLQISSCGENALEELVLESGSKVDIFSCTQTTRQHTRHSSLVTQYQKAVERYIVFKVPHLNATCTVPVTKADKRYFLIGKKDRPKEKLGLVVSVLVKGSYKAITLSSCVKVTNELSTAVDIYYMTERGNEVEFVCSLQPDEDALLPCHAVYTPTSELFFSVKGYSVCINPLIWKRLHSQPNYHQELHCQPNSKKNMHNGPFIFLANCEMEQIYWGNTSRRTIDSIMIQVSLRPCISLYNLLPVTIGLFPPGTTQDKEIILPGRHLQITNAQMNAMYLELEILSYHGCDWICGKSVDTQLPELSVWTFKKKGVESTFTLDLGMHTRRVRGVTMLSIYCPFWMVNKTGHDITYKTDTTGYTLYHGREDSEAVLFSFRSKSFFGKKKSNIMIENSDWSEKFPLDTVGSCGGVTCKAKDKIYQVSIDIQLAASGLTKIVTFSSFYKALNRCSFNLELCFSDDPFKIWHVVPSRGCIGLWPPGSVKACYVRVQYTSQITSLIHFDIAHATLFKLENEYGGIFAEVTVSEGGNILSLDQCMQGVATALVINHLKCSSVTLWQEDHEMKKIEIGPKMMKYFTWVGAHSQILNFSCMGLPPIVCSIYVDSRGTIGDGLAAWATWMNGVQRCLVLSEDPVLLEGPFSSCKLERISQELEISFNSIGLSLVNDLQKKEILYLSLSSSGVAWENRKQRGKKYRSFTEAETIELETAYWSYMNACKTKEIVSSVFQIGQTLKVDFNDMRVLKPFKREMRRIFQSGIWLQMQSLETQRNLHIKVNKIQLDNQLGDVIFPVVLARVPPPKSVLNETVPKPFFEMSIIQSLESVVITQYKYISVLIQEFHFRLELPFLFAVIEAIYPAESIDTLYSPEKYEKDLQIISRNLSEVVTGRMKTSRRDFFEYLHLSPIKMHLSFSLTGLDSGSSIPVGGHIIHLFLQSVGVTLTEVQDVIFRLGFFEKRRCWLTIEGFQEDVTSHYINQIVTQLYVLVLGLDVLGNPFGLVLGVTKGFGDLFYEPFQGAVEGPDEFAQGLFYGMQSFMGKTVGGAAGAFSRITGTIGKGIASLTLDEDYQRNRREALKKPGDGLEAMARGGKGIVTGVFDGVTGVFLKPFEGAKQEGVEGFFKGVGKGMVGLVTRPASGLIDFTSGSFDAVMRATDSTEDIAVVRPARFISSDGIIRPFNYRYAIGTKLLHEIEKGKYSSTDIYVVHSLSSDGRNILLTTDQRLFFVGRNDILGQWKIEWIHCYEELAEAPILSSSGIRFTIKTPKKKLLGVFGGGSNNKEVTLQDVHEHKWILEQITQAYIAAIQP